MKTARLTGFGVGSSSDKAQSPRAKNGGAHGDAFAKIARLPADIIKNLVAGSDFGSGEVLVYGTPNTDIAS